MLNFNATTKVKNRQNRDRVVRNHTLRVCDIQREQTLFKHGLKVKKWPRNGPKIDQKFTKVEQHFHRNKRHAGDGHDDVAWNDVCAYNAPPDASVPQDPGSMGRDKGSLFSETLTTAAQRAGGI